MPEWLVLVLAGTPVLVLIGLLLCRVRPLPSVVVAIAVLFLLGFWFPIDTAEFGELSVRLSGVTLNVVFILFGGILLSGFAADSGAQQQMSEWFETAAHNRIRMVLMIGMGVTPLMESVIGWGIGVVIGVPLLLRAGLSTTKAATVALLGLAMCPWGSLGPGLLVTAQLGQIDFGVLGSYTAVYNLAVLGVMGATIAIVGVGARMTVRLALEYAAAIVTMWIVLLAVNLFLSPALAGILASLTAILVLLLGARLQGARPRRMTQQQVRAFGPYGLLVCSMLIVTALSMIVPLGAWRELVTSPGLWLTITAAFAPAIFQMQRSDAFVSLARGLTVWAPVCLMTVLYIVFGVLLSVSGMSTALADKAASGGAVFLLALPFISVLAGYVTASNTSVATMLTFGVSDATAVLGSNTAAALGAQTAAAGAAVGASPARIALAMGIADQFSSSAQSPPNFARIALVLIAANLVAATLIALALFVTPR
jgi:lactate permease